MPRVHHMPGAPRIESKGEFERFQQMIHSWILVEVLGEHSLEPHYRRLTADQLPVGSWDRSSVHLPLIRPGEQIWFHIKAVGNCENGFPYVVVNVDKEEKVDGKEFHFLRRYEYRLWLHRIKVVGRGPD